MKTCPSRLQLEGLALDEVSEGRAAELEGHASACARCRHELNWLRSEAAMFSQRAAREEVSRLWEGFEASAAPRRAQRFARGMLAVAASLVIAVLVGAQLKLPHRPGFERGEALPMSVEMMSVDSQLDARASMPCYTPGFGIACGEVEFATR
jgi:hypothetical protein